MINTITRALMPVSFVYRDFRTNGKLRGATAVISVRFGLREESSDHPLVESINGIMLSVEERLGALFRHKLIVDTNDPEKDYLCSLAGFGLADCIVLEGTKLDDFALLVALECTDILSDADLMQHILVKSVVFSLVSQYGSGKYVADE